MSVRDISARAAGALFLLLLLVAATGLAEAPASAQENTLTAQARSAVEAWLGAVASGDRSRIEAVLAPEFQLQRADGTGYDKAGYLAQGLPEIPSVPEISGLAATVEGDVMVVRYTLTLRPRTIIGGGPVTPTAPRLTVFRRQGDKWLVAAHANFAEPVR